MDKIQFAESIKAKYPEYASIDNNILADKMLTKYPEYKEQITGIAKSKESFTRGISGPSEISETPATERGLLGFGKELLKNLTIIPAAVEAYKTAPLEGSGKLEAGMSVLGNILPYLGGGGAVKEAGVAVEQAMPRVAGSMTERTPELANVAQEAVSPLQKLLTETFKTKSLGIPAKNRLVNLFKPEKLAERTTKKFWERHSQTGKNWQEAVGILEKARPNTSIDLTDFAKTLEPTAGFLPEFRSIIDSNAVLKTFAKNPEAAKQLTIKETQNILNHLNKYISPAAKKGAINPQDIPKINMVMDIKGKILEAFPEAKDVSNLYKKDSQVFKKLVNFFTDLDKAEAGLRKGYNPKDTKSMKSMIKGYFDKQTVKELGGYESIYNFAQIVKKSLIPAGVGGAIATGIILGRN